jgi:hypothetical protein
MHNRLRRNVPLLKLLSGGSRSLKKEVLRTANSDLICSLCECAHNTLKGNIKLSSAQKKKLVKHKKVIRRLAKRGETYKKKKRYIVQTGGAFLPALLGPIIAGIAGLILNK